MGTVDIKAGGAVVAACVGKDFHGEVTAVDRLKFSVAASRMIPKNGWIPITTLDSDVIKEIL